MKIVIAPDKFKGSITSPDACAAIAKGLMEADPTFQVVQVPLADGGDGLSDVIRFYTKAKTYPAQVTDPLFHKIPADWLLSEDGSTAFIEMAKASGLALLSPTACNPEQTTSLGIGELIKEAFDQGAHHILLGI